MNPRNGVARLSEEVKLAIEKRIKSQQDHDQIIGNHKGTGTAKPDLFFTKSLPHDEDGTPDLGSFKTLSSAICDRNVQLWNSIPRGGELKLLSPLSSFTFDLFGPVPFSIGLNVCPSISSGEQAAEIGELYEMAMLRDVPFEKYTNDKSCIESSERLKFFRDYKGPIDLDTQMISPSVLFRGESSGDLQGHYISQFLVLPIPIMGKNYEQKYSFPTSKTNYMDNYRTTVDVQSGKIRGLPQPAMSKIEKYIRTGRDLAWFSERFIGFQPFYHAALILNAMKAPLNPSNPYVKESEMNYSSGIDFGILDILDCLQKAYQLSMRAASYHKWLVHQRIRPEKFALLIDKMFKYGKNVYGLSAQLLESDTIIKKYYKENKKSFCLSQVYPTGSPCDPSYPCEVAVASGACVTILKAFYDQDYILPYSYIVSNDGGRILQDKKGEELTLGGELDKLASNISFGKLFAGVNYRSDVFAGFSLGEQIAIRLLSEKLQTYNEKNAGFDFFTRRKKPVVIKMEME